MRTAGWALGSLCSVQERKLTDGSTAYDVLLPADETAVTIHCATEKDAWTIYETLNKHAVDVSA
jgi:hypothetical protein